MTKADLHLHTNESDGIFSPEELVIRAKRLGLTAIAITDHDTVEGIPGGIRAGNEHGVEVIPGIEISTNLDKGELHILGYFIDYSDKELLKLLDKMKKSRYHRVSEMVKRLNKQGINISIESVLSQAMEQSSLGRPHIARALVEKGYVSDVREAFDKYIGAHCPAYIERYKLDPEEVVDVIIRSGGVPVLAHPGVLSSFDYIERCIKAGIQGIEVYHSKHSPEQSAELLKVAKKYRLIPTGGSDCHGEFAGDCLLLGQITVPYSIVKDLKDKADNNKQGGPSRCQRSGIASLSQK